MMSINLLFKSIHSHLETLDQRWFVLCMW